MARVTRTEDEKQALLAAWHRSGLSLYRFARKNHLSPKTLRGWAAEGPPAFLLSSTVKQGNTEFPFTRPGNKGKTGVVPLRGGGTCLAYIEGISRATMLFLSHALPILSQMGTELLSASFAGLCWILLAQGQRARS